MRTSFHHQPEAQLPNFQLSTSWQADTPSFGASRRFAASQKFGCYWGIADMPRGSRRTGCDVNDPKATFALGRMLLAGARSARF
jgi:hypothetical protein